ncbi:MAG TPA: response regulator, partial [Longimicrobiales bacterium]|nr:response regulator [Longimicrobiales bacterium]
MTARILVVEDSPTQAEILRADLEEAGFEPTVAGDGEEALAVLAAGSFDLVVSDIVMPGPVDGYELCRRIKAGPDQRTPVVLLTALSDPMDIINGLACGADNFLRKPYQTSHLVERLDHLLTTRKARERERVSMGVKILFMGREFTVNSDREQVLDLLITTFEEAVQQNRELREREEELTVAKQELARYARSLEARLERTLSSIPDVLFSVSPSGDEWQYVSPGARAVLGCEPEAVDTEFWRTHLHPEDRAMVEEAARRALETMAPCDFECRFSPDGAEVHWLAGTLVPVSETGGARRIDGIVRDITERKTAEEALRASEAKFALLFKASPIPKGITSLDDDCMVDVNQAFADITGWP